MMDLNFNFIFNISKLFKSNKNKHELKYQTFLKTLDGLDENNIIDILCLKLLNGKFDILILIKNKEVFKMIGDYDLNISQNFKITRIPIIKNGKSKYTLILGMKDNNKFKLQQNYIDLLESVI